MMILYILTVLSITPYSELPEQNVTIRYLI